MISLLIPVYNEQEAIEETLKEAHRTLSNIGEDFEIVVIDDGSTDKTKEVLHGINLPHTKVLTHSMNRGYGASMKTGIRRSSGDLIAITDADGTYPIQDFGRLLNVMKEKDADMVVGARTKKNIPFNRRPAKAIIAFLANRVVGMCIPDNNSGMRIFKRELAEEFMHLYPQGFSFTLTITLAALTNDYMVEFVPIDYFKRKGKSSLSAGFNGVKNFLGFIKLIVRILTYFRPFRFFAIPGGILFFAGLGYIIHTLQVENNVSDAGMLMLLTGLQIGLFGLLAEVVVRQGRANSAK